MTVFLFQVTHKFEFMSTCSDTEHDTVEYFDWEVSDTLQLNLKQAALRRGCVNVPRHKLPIVEGNVNDCWEMTYYLTLDNDIAIYLHYTCLNDDIRQCHAISARVMATVVEDTNNWTEAASVFRHGAKVQSNFSKKLSEFPTTDTDTKSVNARVRWTTLPQSPDIFRSWIYNALRRSISIQCRWTLHDLKSVFPSTKKWTLYSKPFGCGGLLWRMGISCFNMADCETYLKVFVWLQYIPDVVVDVRKSLKGLRVNYTLRNDSRCFTNIMKEGNFCYWKFLANNRYKIILALMLDINFV